ncbi:MAG TPA: response regulator [Candidatus Limnocylindria bacterium]|jgi:DNA-binding response OmpR family regulator
MSAGVSSKKRVVVVGEDDEPIAFLLRDSFNDEPGYQAVVVPDGALVLETVRQVNADLLILDIMMPGLSGFEVYDRIRADPKIKDMPVLFMSAAIAAYDAEFKSRGITDIVSKPFDLNDLVDRVKQLCPADG